MSQFRSSRVLGIGFALLCAATGGGLTGCSSDGQSSTREESATSGRLALPLTAVGASGALYRLRVGDFRIENLDTGVLFLESTENDPFAPVIDLPVPSGNYRVELMSGWFMERESGGLVEQVPATLVSSAIQFTAVSPNAATALTFSFEAEGETVEFGDGNLIIQIEVDETGAVAQSALIETNTASLSQLSLREVLERSLANSGANPSDAELAYRTLIDSFTDQAGGVEPAASHCDDQLAEQGGPGLNGYPLQCTRLESQQLGNLDSWFAIAAVNRLDLAPSDGSNCGQQRLIFANNEPIGNGRMLMILEAEIENPDPACGVGACFPIADFWSAMGNEPDPALRGSMLRDAFLFGGPVPGFPPFMSSSQLGPNGGQIRTNSFNDSPWTLREFHFQPSPSAVLRPRPVAESPNGELWNDLAPLSAGPLCRTEFINSIGGLLTDNPAAMSFSVPEVCKDAESRNDFSQDYAARLVAGSGAFRADLDAALAGTGINAVQLANRARFAGSCMGCHQEASFSDLGNGVTAPPQFDFVHVNEQIVEPCAGGSCFRVSDALRSTFLPHRGQVLEGVLSAGPVCGQTFPLQPEGGSTQLRTLGGQLAGTHAH